MGQGKETAGNAAIDTIATEMRDAFEAGGLTPMFHVAGDHVRGSMNMVHVPAGPNDGDMTVDEVRAMFEGAKAMWAEVCPEGLRVEGTVVVEGNVIVTEMLMNSSFADGRPLRMGSRMDWTVEDGHVVACLARLVQDDGYEAFQKEMQETGRGSSS